MITGLRIGDISIDCQNPAETRAFYATLTGWKQLEAFGCPALETPQGLLILYMPCDFAFEPPVWPEEPGRQQKQLHFNFQAEDLPAAVDEAMRLGATRPSAQYGGAQYVTLLDPEGHPFCLCQK